MKAPKSWGEVTLKQYYNLIEAMEMDWETDLDKAIAQLSALTDISIKDLNEKTPIDEFKKGLASIVFIGEPKPKYVPRPRLRVAGKKFEFDLLLKESMASSFISLADYAKDKDNINKNVHNIMAVFCYEVNVFGKRKPRTVASQKAMAEYLKEHLTMDKAFAYSGFFLTSFQALSKATQDYLESTQMKIAKDLRKEVDQVL